MVHGIIYSQQFDNGDSIYCKVIGKYKAGTLKAIVVHRWNNRKARPALIHSILNQDIWTEAADVPEDVLDRIHAKFATIKEPV